MRKQIPLIAVAVFSIVILLAQNNLPALAQLTFTTTSITYTGNTNNQSSCEYLNNSEVWCSSTSGIKIINPTSKSISQTLFSGIAIQDVECTTSYCYSWHNGDTATANLTQWSRDTHDIVDSTTFTMSGGAIIGRQIDALSAQGAELILLPSSASSCGGAGAGNLKGVCIFDGTEGFFNASRFISSSDTGLLAGVFNIKWSETLNTIAEPTQNNMLVAFQDGAGTKTIRIINLNDPDLTFATTQLCSSTLSSLQESAIFEIFVFNEKYYIPDDLGSTGIYREVPITSATCGVTNTYPTLWDNPVGLVTDGEFFYTASYDGATSKSAVQVYNSTGSALATYNTTNTSAPALPLRNAWYHSTEGELHILGNSRLLSFTVQEGTGGGGSSGRDCDLPENANILICRLGQDGAEVGSAGAFVIGNTTEGTGLLGLGCTMGIVDCSDDPNPQTNGLGLLIFIASIFVIVGMFYAGLGGQQTWALFHGSPIILVLIIVALSAFFTITGIIDPVFLILSIVGIIALATPKIIGTIQNRGFGGGGSTE